MKTLNILALATLLFISPMTGNAGTNAVHTDSIAAKIQSTVHRPDGVEMDDNQRVFVVFSIGQDGAVTVHEVGTANEELKTSIIQQFAEMSFSNEQVSYTGMYSIWLNFKTL